MAIPPEQSEVAALLAGLAGGPPLETHISAVFRGKDTVWKLKKAVRLAFLDFSRPEERRRLLERELALNGQWAPGLYRDVVGAVRGPDGLGLGEGEAFDWVLRMAAVPERDFMDQVAVDGRLDSAMLDGLADSVAGMHAGLAPAHVGEACGRLLSVVEGNARAALEAGLPEGRVEAWRVAAGSALSARRDLLNGRAAGGLVRRAHGDLHLGNMLLWNGHPAPFDALEFDEALATIDLGYDLAFLLMDLDCTVSRQAANRVLARYVARTGDVGLAGGLPPFLGLRAMVRAHVAAASGKDGSRYLDAAEGYLRPGRGMVVAVGGLMGTGKSTLARALAPGLGPAPGALVLRTDEIRKRLHGRAPEERLPPEAYSPVAHAQVDDTLIEAVRGAAAGGHAVLADATFMDPELRHRVRAAAADAGMGFLGVWLDAPLEELERRVSTRTGDASDADLGVLRAASARVVVPDDWLRVDARNAGAALGVVQNACSSVLESSFERADRSGAASQ